MHGRESPLARAPLSAAPDLIPPTLLRSPVIAVAVTSPDGDLVEVNDTFRRLLGYASTDSLLKKNFRREVLAEPSGWQRWQQGPETGETVEMRFLSAGGGDLVLRGHVERVRHAASRADRLRGVFVDHTPAQHLQETLLRTAGMDAVSSMAAGVCHDFNNLLTVLVGNLYLAAESVRNDPSIHEKLKRARNAAKRGADLSRQLMAFAKNVEAETDLAIVSVENAVAALLPLLGSALGSKIALKTSIDANVPSVKVNRAQLESVLTNLVINARDALSGVPNGTVIIRVARISLDTAAATLHRVKQGEYVTVGVRDNGAGMPDAVKARAFEPFYSTKGKGKGNGLGLPMVRWFAERSGGAVSLHSLEKEGTTVTVLLPACESAATDETMAATMPLSALPGGHEPIVVVSSDGDFRSMVEQILAALGYKVVTTDVAASVVSLAAEHRAASLVIDSQMLSRAVFERISGRLRQGGSRVGVVVVGDNSFKWPTTAVTVPKPFGLPELSRAVRDSMKGEA